MKIEEIKIGMKVKAPIAKMDKVDKLLLHCRKDKIGIVKQYSATVFGVVLVKFPRRKALMLLWADQLEAVE